MTTAKPDEIIEHPLVPGLFLLLEQQRYDDYCDKRTCTRCGRVIGYARAALKCGSQDVIHGTTEFDCTDDRNWLACSCAPDAFGVATAAKRGRNPRYPHVPIINHDPAGTRWKARTEQILKRAYADRQDAIDCAQRVIDYRRAMHVRDLNEYRNRATREAEGLPRELADALALMSSAITKGSA